MTPRTVAEVPELPQDLDRPADSDELRGPGRERAGADSAVRDLRRTPLAADRNRSGIRRRVDLRPDGTPG